MRERDSYKRKEKYHILPLYFRTFIISVNKNINT